MSDWYVIDNKNNELIQYKGSTGYNKLNRSIFTATQNKRKPCWLFGVKPKVNYINGIWMSERKIQINNIRANAWSVTYGLQIIDFDQWKAQFGFYAEIEESLTDVKGATGCEKLPKS